MTPMNRMSTVAVSVFVAIGLLPVAPAPGQFWEITVVDTAQGAGVVAGESSVAVLPSGHPAISYFHALDHCDLKYAWYDGSVWQTEVVDSEGSVGRYNSLAILPSGYPAISYWDGTNNDLKYAWYDGSTWHRTTVQSLNDVGKHNSLAILPSGQPAISYYAETTGNLRYAWYDGSTWHRTTVDSDGDVGMSSSLAILPSGQPAISYCKHVAGYVTDLKFAWYDGTAWQTEIVVESEGNSSSLAILPSGEPAIAYVYSFHDELKYAWHDGVGWQTTFVADLGDDECGGYASLAILPSGHPGISYVYDDSSELYLRFTWYDGSAWQITTIEREYWWRHQWRFYLTDLAILPSGQPAITYQTYTSADRNSVRLAAGADVAAAPVGMSASYAARAWTELGGETVVENGPAHNSGSEGWWEFPAWAGSWVALESTPGHHLRGLVSLAGVDGMECSWWDPNTGECCEWDSISCADASGTVTGTLQIGTSEEYPAGSVLELALEVVISGDPGDAEEYQLQLRRDGALIAHIDPNAPDPVAVVVEAGETLTFELFALEEDWYGWGGGYQRWFEFRLILLAPEPIPGDIDGDGDVDLADLAALLGAYGTCLGDPDYNPDADLDDSGCIDLADLAELLGHYGTGT